PVSATRETGGQGFIPFDSILPPSTQTDKAPPNAGNRQGAPRIHGFTDPVFVERHVRPAGETILPVPFTLSMPQQHDFFHRSNLLEPNSSVFDPPTRKPRRSRERGGEINGPSAEAGAPGGFDALAFILPRWRRQSERKGSSSRSLRGKSWRSRRPVSPY